MLLQVEVSIIKQQRAQEVNKLTSSKEENKAEYDRRINLTKYDLLIKLQKAEGDLQQIQVFNL